VSVRTRIAPSPTGDPHVGTAYIALFNYCFAKSQGGAFILRIEDTDQVRSTRESEEAILAALSWVGLQWDEGPDVGGPHGPYRQSERSELYQRFAQQLLDQGHAYKDVSTEEELSEMRRRQKEAGSSFFGVKRKNLALTDEDIERRVAAGEPYIVRLKVPDEGTVVIHDRLRGEIVMDWSTVDDQVLLKSDGLPTYHLANVVDDHHMKITHVIRGEEWISSAPKHKLLYDYFGWEMPELIHMPLLRNADSSKLSKRKNPTSILYFERAGFLPEALLNYLGQLGWSLPDTDREKFTLDEMVEAFKVENQEHGVTNGIDRVSTGGPIFDREKLTALNSEYISELSPEEFFGRLGAWARGDYLQSVATLIQSRTKTLGDIAVLASHFFMDVPNYTKDDLVTNRMDAEQTQKALLFMKWELDGLRDWSIEEIRASFARIADGMGVRPRDFNKPFFVAMSGSTVSTPLYESLVLLGADLSRVRVRRALSVISTDEHGNPKPLGKKPLKRMDKEYQALLAAAASAGDETNEGA